MKFALRATFMENYFIAFPLSEKQFKWLNDNSFVRYLGDERNTGRTSFMLSVGVWEIITRPNKTVAYLGGSWLAADYARNMVGDMLGRAPESVVPRLTRKNKTTFEFDNGSKIIFGETTRDIHSKALDILILDNTAQWNYYGSRPHIMPDGFTMVAD